MAYGDGMTKLSPCASALVLPMLSEALGDFSDGIPPISISVGVALGSEAADGAELFEHADQALYVTKRSGKGGITFFAAGDD